MEIVLTSIIAFITTNIDDVFILVLFFGSKAHKNNAIFVGQYLGIGLLIFISLLGAWIGNFIENKYIGLLGFFPIYLGIKSIIDLLRNKQKKGDIKVEAQSSSYEGILSVATVTFANGGDNIGVYIPLFTSLEKLELFIMMSIFFCMVFLWILLAKYLTNHPLLARKIEEYGHLITPIVLCFLGFFILIENGSLDLVHEIKIFG